MQTTVFAKVPSPDIERLRAAIGAMVKKIQDYVPGYQMLVEPTLEGGRIIVTVKVQGLGDYLPKFAGNLDIINCAAIAAAEEYAQEWARRNELCGADGSESLGGGDALNAESIDQRSDPA